METPPHAGVGDVPQGGEDRRGGEMRDLAGMVRVLGGEPG